MPDAEMLEFAKHFSSACEKMAAALDVNVDCNLNVREVRAVVDWMHVAAQPGVQMFARTMSREEIHEMVDRVVGS